MPKRTKYVVLSKAQVKTAMLAQTTFTHGEVNFIVEDNKIAGCTIIQKTADSNVYEVIEFSRKEIDDTLIKLNKQENTNGGIVIQYQQQGVLDPNVVNGEHLFDMVVIRYGAEVQIDTRVLNPDEPQTTPITDGQTLIGDRGLAGF